MGMTIPGKVNTFPVPLSRPSVLLAVEYLQRGAALLLISFIDEIHKDRQILHMEVRHANEHRDRRSPDAAGYADERRANKTSGRSGGSASVGPDQRAGRHPSAERKSCVGGGSQRIPVTAGEAIAKQRAIDCLIATRDFEPFEKLLDLSVIHP